MLLYLIVNFIQILGMSQGSRVRGQGWPWSHRNLQGTRPPSALTVMRLGGAQLGGYGEARVRFRGKILEKQGRRLERFWVGKVAEALYDLYIYVYVYICGICEAFLSWFSEVISIMYQYHSEEMRHVHTLSGPTELCHMQVAS